MQTYVIRRLLMIIPTLFIVSFVVFILVHFVPGDYIDAIQAQSTFDEPLDRPTMERKLGLDQPLMVQYGRWMGFVRQQDGNFSGVIQGNFGTSWYERKPVVELVGKKWPVTLELSILGIIIGQLIAFPIGMYSALRQDKWGDYAGRSFAILCISIPGFWLATMVIVMPAVWWNYMPPIMLIRITEDLLGNLRMFIIPAIVLGMAMAGFTMRLMRTMMLEVLRQDYIRTAWAKGLRERQVTIRHALQNALIPVVSAVGLQLRILIGGTVVIEQVFCLPGMGRLILNALFLRDEPLILGVLIFYSIAMVLINLLVDISYAFIDPRIHYK